VRGVYRVVDKIPLGPFKLRTVYDVATLDGLKALLEGTRADASGDPA
jgi:hypothetical protein